MGRPSRTFVILFVIETIGLIIWGSVWYAISAASPDDDWSDMLYRGPIALVLAGGLVFFILRSSRPRWKVLKEKREKEERRAQRKVAGK